MDTFYVETRNLKKSFDSEEIVRGVDIGVKKGSLAALLGPSGSGKTTVLRMIAGLEQADAGEVLVDGRVVNDVPAQDRGIGFLFQNYALFSHMTVADNIGFGLSVKKASKDEKKTRVDELLELIGLGECKNKYPYELSGGQKQRVAFARALAPEPKLLLLDEPFAAIDAKIRSELRFWLREMIYRVGITSVFVTHDQEEAVEVADSIIILNEGKVEQTGAPDEVYLNPSGAFAAGFIGSSTEIPDYGVFRGFKDQGSGRAIIRPEYMEAFKEDNPLFKDVLKYSEDAVITDVRFCGNRYELTLCVCGYSLKVHRSLERRPIKVGEKMHLLIYRLLTVEGDDVRMIENRALENADRLYSLYHW